MFGHGKFSVLINGLLVYLGGYQFPYDGTVIFVFSKPAITFKSVSNTGRISFFGLGQTTYLHLTIFKIYKQFFYFKDNP